MRAKEAAQKKYGQSELNAMLIEHARKGRVVVRLKGGDPFIFGAAARRRGAGAARIEFEVVPGVTSAIAGPAFAACADASRARLVCRARHRPRG